MLFGVSSQAPVDALQISQNPKRNNLWKYAKVIFESVGPDGLEPSTHGLKVRCSTD